MPSLNTVSGYPNHSHLESHKAITFTVRCGKTAKSYHPIEDD